MAATVTPATPASVRLRRSDCSGTGIHRVKHGSGFRYLDHDGDPVRDEEILQRIRRAGHPARLEGRLDLPPRGRAHPGDRHRRRRTQAVPLPPALARAARHREVRRHAGLRALAAEAAPARRGRPRARGPVLRPRVRHRGAAAGPRVLPRRGRGLRRAQRDLRPGDDAEAARTPARRRAALRLPGQARQASRAGGDRPRGRRRRRPAQAPSRGRGGAARLQARTRLARRQVRRTSTRG